MSQPSVVVVGAGVIGAWTARWLAEAGHAVTLVDQYAPASPLATSADETRVTRSAHGEDRHYPAWQRRALALWLALDPTLFVATGVLWLARAPDGMEAASLATLKAMGVPAERLSADEVAVRWPQVATEDLGWGLFEPEGGVLMARRALLATLDAADAAGVRLVRGRVIPPQADAAAARLDRLRLADGAELEADAFVFAAGPWLGRLFSDLLGTDALAVTRQEVVYFATPPGDGRFKADALPTWAEYDAAIYGLPSIDGRGLKVAPDRPGPLTDPDTQERVIGERSVATARAYLRRRFPAMAAQPVSDGRVCQYASTPDAHFIIDRHPAWANAWIAGGGSGHAFKHGPVIGEYAAALVTGDARRAGELAPPDGRFRLAKRARAGSGLRTSGAEDA
ncbi:MAG TPA: FAD-dependent oxidoreductase [Candidatus Limnocylindria bacterium]